MLKPLLILVACFAVASCGSSDKDTCPSAPLRQARAQVSSWDMGPELGKRKQTVYDTCKQAGRSDDIAALLIAVGMAETQHFSAAERDISKDQAGDSRNFAAYNFNLDFLRSIGHDLSQVERLNSDDALPEATQAALKGIDQYGVDGFLNFHRGGRSGLETGTAYGCVEYREAIKAVRQAILSSTDSMTNNQRLGMYIQHV